MSRRKRSPVPPIAIVVAGIAVAFLAIPLIGLAQRADWANAWDDLTDPATLDALRLSLVCSLAATAIAALLGLPMAWVLARVEFRGRSIVRALVLLPMVLPPVVAGVALGAAFSRRGLIGSWLFDAAGVQLTFSMAGVIMAEAFVAMPFFIITVEGALRSMDRRYEDVASTLGATRTATFGRVTLPLIAPSVAAGAVLAWARALGEFGATITFAGNIQGRTQTLPLAVYQALESRPTAAIAMSLLLLVVALAVLAVLRDRWLVRT